VPRRHHDRDQVSDTDVGRLLHRQTDGGDDQMTGLRAVSAASLPFTSICRHLAVASGAASVPYFIGIESVPEPIVGFLIASVVGVAGGELEARAKMRRSPNDRSATTIVAKSQVPTPRAPLAVTEPAPAIRTPKNRPKPATVDFGRYERCNSETAEIQCPHCGAFAVTTKRLDSGVLDVRCEVCATRWQLDGSLDLPDVAVRSWLHR
jgi:predicted Zn finger-like uncharacterized protein